MKSGQPLLKNNNKDRNKKTKQKLKGNKRMKNWKQKEKFEIPLFKMLQPMSLLIKILAYIYEDNQVREPTTLN